MRILFLSPINSIFLHELSKRLIERCNATIFILDLFNDVFVNAQDNDIRYIKVKKKPNRLIRNLLFIKNVIKYRSYIKRADLKFDICNIHYVDSRYIFIINFFKKRIPKLFASIYGADFYYYKKYKFFLTRILDKADKITFTNEFMEMNFLKEFEQYREKTTILHFGLSNLELLNKFYNDNRTLYKKKLNFPLDKKIVLCGYSSSPFHQHLKVINSLVKVETSIWDKVFLVFPMTYGGYADQVSKVKEALSHTRFDFAILENYLSDEDIASLRFATDIMLNVPVYDQLSGTLQENIFIGNTVIAGTWLPYKVFDDMGVDYIKVDSIENVGIVLKENIESVRIINKQKNKEIIWNFSNWDICLQKWINLYTQKIS
ncbi:MAG: glycosyltransferase [Bacteroidales bacterium]